jgi:3D (Asp-Asp-Asp) domain-containing protein
LAKGGSIAVLETGGVVVGDRVDIYLEIEAVLNA